MCSFPLYPVWFTRVYYACLLYLIWMNLNLTTLKLPLFSYPHIVVNLFCSFAKRLYYWKSWVFSLNSCCCPENVKTSLGGTLLFLPPSSGAAFPSPWDLAPESLCVICELLCLPSLPESSPLQSVSSPLSKFHCVFHSFHIYIVILKKKTGNQILNYMLQSTGFSPVTHR